MRAVCMRLCFVLGVCIGLTGPVRAADQVLQVALEDWAPFLSERLPEYGPMPERLSLLLRNANLVPRYRFLPFPRTLRSLTEGRDIDAAFPLAKTREREAFLLFSEPLFEVEVSLFVRAEASPSRAELMDPARKLKVGVIRKSVSSWICERNGMQCSPADTGEQVLRMLAAHRVDAAVLVRDFGLWLLANRLNTQPVTIQVLDPPETMFSLYLAFPRARPESEARVAQVNAALAELQKNGMWSQRLRDLPVP